MNAYNIINKDNLSTNKAIAEIVTGMGVDLLKYLRFDVGCADHEKMEYILMLERLACSDYCKIEEEDRSTIREEIISKGINYLKELD